MSYTKEQIAAALDPAVLKPTAATGDVIATARQVQDDGIASLCVAPCNVRLAKRYTDRVCVVIGFPHGNTTPEVKEYEARQAIAHGAIELDVVCNVGRFLDGRRVPGQCPDPPLQGRPPVHQERRQ
jgi:deoxyribose-phosphate aldolase